MPLVSVTIPAYNAEKYIGKAIKSLLAQTFCDWECIIIDDGSTDNTYNIIKLYKDEDSRFRIFRFEENRGQAITRQFALEKARGKYLAMLDSDDWIYSNKLKDQVKIMEERRDLCLVSTLKAISNEDDELLGISNSPNNYSLNKVNEPLSKAKVPVVHAASLIDMEVAKKCNYKHYLKRSEDSDFLRQVLYKGNWMILDKVTYVHRNLSTPSFKKVLRSYLYEIIALCNSLKLYPLSALKGICLSIGKLFIITVAGLLGKFGTLRKKTRWRPPTEPESEKFNKEYETNFI